MLLTLAVLQTDGYHINLPKCHPRDHLRNDSQTCRRWYDNPFLAISHHFQACERAGRVREVVGFDAQALQHAHEHIA